MIHSSDNAQLGAVLDLERAPSCGSQLMHVYQDYLSDKNLE
jgi:uncharacterized protein YbbK (DUF523 family)